MFTQLNKNGIIENLKKGLPGKQAQFTMAPKTHRNFHPSDDYKRAAVLILLYEEAEETKIVFIKRNEYRGYHSGQVSFPGGMFEQSDHNLEYTAVREAAEETGVSENIIELLGPLTQLYIPLSNICVQPFIGWVTNTPVFKPDRREVQYLICPGTKQLFDHENLKEGTFIRGKTDIVTPYFDISGEIIWGATAMILGEFRAVIDY